MIKVLAAEPKKGASLLVATPPPTLTRLVQRLRRQISLAWYTIPLATQAMLSETDVFAG